MRSVIFHERASVVPYRRGDVGMLPRPHLREDDNTSALRVGRRVTRRSAG